MRVDIFGTEKCKVTFGLKYNLFFLCMCTCLCNLSFIKCFVDALVVLGNLNKELY